MMPIFNFYIHGAAGAEDGYESDLADEQAAQIEATRLVGEMLQFESRAFWKNGYWRVDVTDEDELAVLSLNVIATEPPTGKVSNDQ